jgi:hypothetical protein
VIYSALVGVVAVVLAAAVDTCQLDGYRLNRGLRGRIGPDENNTRTWSQKSTTSLETIHNSKLKLVRRRKLVRRLKRKHESRGAETPRNLSGMNGQIFMSTMGFQKEWSKYWNRRKRKSWNA